MHVVGEAPAPRDLDDGNPFAVLRLELGVVVDRDLEQLEAQLVAGRVHDAAGCLTEMAARRGVQLDVERFYG